MADKKKWLVGSDINGRFSPFTEHNFWITAWWACRRMNKISSQGLPNIWYGATMRVEREL